MGVKNGHTIKGRTEIPLDSYFLKKGKWQPPKPTQVHANPIGLPTLEPPTPIPHASRQAATLVERPIRSV